MDFLHKKIELRNLIFRVRNKIRRIIFKKKEFSSSEFGSDSQESFYLDQIKILLKEEKSLLNFRRKYDYQEILEHVSYKLGKQYLRLIKNQPKEDFNQLLVRASRNDTFGSPHLFRYGKGIRISPTTLRYVQTALDIKNTIGLDYSDKVVEIGVGYGGQASILETLFNIEDYDAFDLPEVIDLSNMFLRGIGSNIQFEHNSILENHRKSWSVLISNYAFSELHKELQILYLENLISRTSRGYMIMNSGRTNLTGRSRGKLSLNEILDFLPNAKVKEENPLTGPDNYVLYWKN